MTLASLHLLTRLPHSREQQADDSMDHCVFVPALDRFPPMLRETIGLLPVSDINGSLLDALAMRRPDDDVSGVIAGIFAADPFLDFVDLIDRLRDAKIMRVANFPTLQHFDGATAAGLAAVGYDGQAELATLKRLAAAGLDVVAYVATLKATEMALASGFTTLAYHPGLPPVPPSERTTLTKIRALAKETGAQLLILKSMIAADEIGAVQPISP